MRLKTVEVSSELIEMFLRAGNEFGPCRIQVGIPEGAKLVAVRTEPNPFERLGRVEIQTVQLIFEHESFPQVELGAVSEPFAVIVDQVAPFPREL